MLSLGDDQAQHRDLVGGKAAALATATRAGHRTVDGFVLTTAGTQQLDRGNAEPVLDAVRAAWEQLTDGGAGRVVARSSSVVEDAEDDSMAGRYETVADVADWDDLRASVQTVLASRQDVAADTELSEDHAIAVLVQRQLEPDWGGVAFGVAPVSGRPDRRVVVAGDGAPEELVAGTVEGDRWVTEPDGAVIESSRNRGTDVPVEVIGQVVELVGAVGELFGEPQDIEWAADADGTVWLLQARPVTTQVTGVPTGPVLGTGPIAETFPACLSALERDLWLPPLRAAIATALEVTAVAASDDIDSSPVVVDVDGHPAVDLELFGRVESETSPIRDRVRRIAASWRLGRLRSALPRAARRIVRDADEALATVDELHEYDTAQLLDLLDNSGPVLRSLHGHEALIGLLADPGDTEVTGTGVGLRALAAARRDGLDGREAIARDPAILALCAPRISGTPSLPPTDDLPPLRGGAPDPDDPGVLREALRMRVRWVHELTARASEELGRRLASDGLLDDPDRIRDVALAELCDAVHDGTRPALADSPGDDGLPTRFRLTEDGVPVPEAGSGDEGVAAGGGVGQGPALHHRPDDGLDHIGHDVVLVTENLDPDLAPVLPRLAGLVATTGNPLSHVAILARESGIPTVVGLASAFDRLPDGHQVRVDGDAGDVQLQEEEAT